MNSPSVAGRPFLLVYVSTVCLIVIYLSVQNRSNQSLAPTVVVTNIQTRQTAQLTFQQGRNKNVTDQLMEENTTYHRRAIVDRQTDSFNLIDTVIAADKTELRFDCSAILAGQRSAVRRAERAVFVKLLTANRGDSGEPSHRSRCHTLRTLLAVNESMNNTDPYPLAYSIIVYKNFVQFWKLFRQIYRPWNCYCIHVDTKAASDFLWAVEYLGECLSETVLFPSRREDVRWGAASVLDAALNCLRAVTTGCRNGWRHLLNIAGTDFPLQTQTQMAENLRRLNGASVVQRMDGTLDRWKYTYSFVGGANNDQLIRAKCAIHKSKLAAKAGGKHQCVPLSKKAAAPHGLRVQKGSFSVALSRRFVQFLLTSPLAHSFYQWCQDVYIPDEFFWSTLYHSYWWQLHHSNDTSQLYMRYTHWGGLQPACLGYYEHGLCVYGVGDLRWLVAKPHLFAHKFDYDFQPAPIDCLQWRLNNTL